MVNITIVNSIFSTIPKLEIEPVLDIISYRQEWWSEGKFSRQKQIFYKQALLDKSGLLIKIFTGHIPRIVNGLKAKGIETNIIGSIPKITKQSEPYLKPRLELNPPFERFKPFQYQMITTAIEEQRGCFESITGTGKTVMQMGIMSAYPKSKILLLCHTTGVIKQTAKEMVAWGFKEPQIIGAGEGTGTPQARIVLATIQSFAKLDPKTYQNYFNMVIIDENHRVNSFEGQYYDVLININAPMRFGFSGTQPPGDKAVLAYEALLGRKISELNYQEAQELGITAKPQVKIIKLPFNDSLKAIRNYRDMYNLGITTYEIRNNKICDIIEEVVNNDENALVFVSEIAQGRLIQKIFYDRYKVDMPFVNSEMPVNEREKIKEQLNSKEIPYCVCTGAWSQGINIPELDNIIMGSIGKSEISLLQSAGRGNRATINKKTFKLWILYESSSHFSIAHFGEQMCILSDKGWI